MTIENHQDEQLTIEDNENIQKIAMTTVKANPYQPRKTFDEERLNDLAKSIKLHGILQPIVLRKRFLAIISLSAKGDFVLQQLRD